MTESEIERRMVQQIKNRGGLSYKFVSPSAAGVPDRIVLLPDGRTIYIELKTKTGRLRKIQAWQIEQMRKRGADVRVLKGWEQVQKFLDEVFPKVGDAV